MSRDYLFFVLTLLYVGTIAAWIVVRIERELHYIRDKIESKENRP